MVIQIERPLDLLNNCKGKKVLVYLKNKKIYSGILLAFDLTINIALDNCNEIVDGKEQTSFGKTFIRGESVELISPGNG